MKALFIFVLGIACTLGFPERRFFLDTFGLSNPFNLESLKADLQLMDDVLGSDPKEKACEAECHKLLAEGHVLHYGCPLVCHSFQELLHFLAVTPDPPTKPAN